jgi:hypothetical protein
MNEVIKRWWRVEMRERCDDPGHWYPYGDEHASLSGAIHYLEDCWKPRYKKFGKKASARIVRHEHTKRVEIL